jgi:hypothetical protein
MLFSAFLEASLDTDRRRAMKSVWPETLCGALDEFSAVADFTPAVMPCFLQQISGPSGEAIPPSMPDTGLFPFWKTKNPPFI